MSTITNTLQTQLNNYTLAQKEALNYLNQNAEQISILINERLKMDECKNLNYLHHFVFGKEVKILQATVDKYNQLVITYELINKSKSKPVYYIPQHNLAQYIMDHSVTYSFLFN